MNDIERARLKRDEKRAEEAKPLRSDWLHLPGQQFCETYTRFAMIRVHGVPGEPATTFLHLRP